MNDSGFFAIFMRHLAMAIPWGVVFLVVFAIAAVGVKQEVKEAIQYTALNFESVSRPCPMAYHHPFDVKAESEAPGPETR